MLNFALFGAGRIGSIHAENVAHHSKAQLVAVYDPLLSNAERIEQQYGCKHMLPEQIFSDEKIDAILICSATDTHADLIEQAVAAGKHVFCEKPIDLSLARAKSCLKRVSQSHCKVMVAFNRRFDPNFHTLHQKVSDGTIGSVEMVSIISKDPSPPPEDYVSVSGGLFRDMTIHDFDMARFLLTEEISSIHAQASCLVDPAIGKLGDIDTAVITLSTKSGKLAQISNSRRAIFGYDQRIEVHGSEGMLTAQNMAENTVEIYNQNGVTRANPMHFFLERYAEAYRLEMDQFIAHLLKKDIAVPTLHDGLQSLMLAEAANISLQQGRLISMEELS